MKNPLKVVVGNNLRALRTARGLTQEQLADLLEVTPRYLAGIERGERNLTLDSIADLAHNLGIAPEDLIKIPPGPPADP